MPIPEGAALMVGNDAVLFFLTYVCVRTFTNLLCSCLLTVLFWMWRREQEQEERKGKERGNGDCELVYNCDLEPARILA